MVLKPFSPEIKQFITKNFTFLCGVVYLFRIKATQPVAMAITYWKNPGP